MIFRHGGDEGQEIAAAEKLGEEQGGVALGFGTIDPTEARPQYACLTAPLSEDSATIAAHLHRPISLRSVINYIFDLSSLLIWLWLWLWLCLREKETSEREERESVLWKLGLVIQGMKRK